MPLAFQIHSSDNVATMLDDAAVGDTIEVIGGQGAEIQAISPVASGHKIALAPMAEGDAVLKYGVRIGHATAAIAAGEEDVQVIGFPGCYDNAYAIRLMLALARHSNVGAVLAVGLGCEYTQPEKIADVVRESGRPAEWFFIQQNGGTRQSVVKGKEIVLRMRDVIRAETPVVPMGFADLTIGCECGGSDASSGLAGNPTVGAFFDLLVDSGGRAIIEETVEMIGLRSHLVARAANASAAEQLANAYDKAERYCHSVRQWSVSPGNFAGGLTTIEEKSLGALARP